MTSTGMMRPIERWPSAGGPLSVGMTPPTGARKLLKNCARGGGAGEARRGQRRGEAGERARFGGKAKAREARRRVARTSSASRKASRKNVSLGRRARAMVSRGASRAFGGRGGVGGVPRKRASFCVPSATPRRAFVVVPAATRPFRYDDRASVASLGRRERGGSPEAPVAEPRVASARSRFRPRRGGSASADESKKPSARARLPPTPRRARLSPRRARLSRPRARRRRLSGRRRGASRRGLVGRRRFRRASYI